MPLEDMMKAIANQESIKNQLVKLEQSINKKNIELVALNESKKEKQEKVELKIDISIDIVKEFCNMVREVLVGFGYKQVEEVTFTFKEADIRVDGLPRISNGKGFRAFFYTAFTIALMQYTRAKDYPFSGFLVFDSPVTTLKEEDIKSGKVEQGDLIENTL